jgi:transposase
MDRGSRGHLFGLYRLEDIDLFIRSIPFCPHCDAPLSLADQPLIHAYDHIDLPPTRPIVTRINSHRGVCPCCQNHVSASAPEGFAPGLPFGPQICALISHLARHPGHRVPVARPADD